MGDVETEPGRAMRHDPKLKRSGCAVDAVPDLCIGY